MDVNLAAPPSPIPLPADVWILYSLKTFGFFLHAIPMQLWYAGLLLALLRWLAGARGVTDWPARFARQLPFFLAFGINAGLVPLLFTQVLFHHVFYPATMLMAWWWLGAIPLLLLAYCLAYRLVSLTNERQPPAWRILLTGGTAWFCLAVIGFLFANAFSMMVRLDAWGDIAVAHGVSGAVRGTALNLADPSLMPRWILMFALALTTSAWHPIVDRLFRGEQPAKGDLQFSTGTYLAGAVLFAAAGTWYVFGTWPPHVSEPMWRLPFVLLTLATACAPAIPGTILVVQTLRGGNDRLVLWFGAVGQLLVVALNAVSRQVVQHLELAHLGLVRTEPVSAEVWPLLIFVFALGVGIVLVVSLVAAAWKHWGKVEHAPLI